MREEFGELDEMDRLFVTVCESVVKPDAFEYAKWKGIGRPTTNRTAVFKAFLFKALYDIPTTRELASATPTASRSTGTGGKVHAAVTRDGIPVAVAYISAPLHDSQVMIPLVKKASQHLMYGVLVIAVEQTMRLLC